MRKTLLSALGLAAALSGTACTQDKDKVFGRPPEIQRRFDEQQHCAQAFRTATISHSKTTGLELTTLYQPLKTKQEFSILPKDSQ
jgi:hypothetical protein